MRCELCSSSRNESILRLQIFAPLTNVSAISQACWEDTYMVVLVPVTGMASARSAQITLRSPGTKWKYFLQRRRTQSRQNPLTLLFPLYTCKHNIHKGGERLLSIADEYCETGVDGYVTWHKNWVTCLQENRPLWESKAGFYLYNRKWTHDRKGHATLRFLMPSAIVRAPLRRHPASNSQFWQFGACMVKLYFSYPFFLTVHF